MLAVVLVVADGDDDDDDDDDESSDDDAAVASSTVDMNILVDTEDDDDGDDGLAILDFVVVVVDVGWGNNVVHLWCSLDLVCIIDDDPVLLVDEGQEPNVQECTTTTGSTAKVGRRLAFAGVDVVVVVVVLKLL